MLDGLPSRIIGILPAEQLDDADVWEPHTLYSNWDALRSARGAGPWFVVAQAAP